MSGTTAAPAVAPAPVWSARLGLATAAGVVLAVLVAVWLGLPDPWWAAISASRVASPDRLTTLTTGVRRIVGTIAGAAVGYVGAGLAADSMPLQLLLLFAVGAGGTWARFTSPRASYTWTLGTMTAVMVLVQSLAGVEGLYAFAVARTLEILCGVVVGTAAVIALGAAAETAAVAAAAIAAARPPDPRVAALGGLALVVVPILWSVLQLPALTQIAVSVIVVLDPDAVRLRSRGWQRLLGCVAGGGMGLAAIALGLDGVIVWAVVLGGGMFLFSILVFGAGPNAYLGVQGSMALTITLVTGPGAPATLIPVLDRLVGVTLGVLVVAVLAWALGMVPAAAGRDAAARP